MKTILMSTAALALLAAPALAQPWLEPGFGKPSLPAGDIEATVAEEVEPVLNGDLDLGGSSAFDDSEIDAEVDVEGITGETTTEITDQIDSVTGKVVATSTNVTEQVNRGDVSATARIGRNAGNRAASVTSAAIGNTMSVVNGITQ
jgi:hypothetical protein